MSIAAHIISHLNTFNWSLLVFSVSPLGEEKANKVCMSTKIDIHLYCGDVSRVALNRSSQAFYGNVYKLQSKLMCCDPWSFSPLYVKPNLCLQ